MFYQSFGFQLEVNLDRNTNELGVPTSLKRDQQLPSGTLLANRYYIFEVIGIGGMGFVYRARDMHFSKANKIVAVKEVISQVRDASKQRAAIENFEREANIIASLSHQSIPKIYDYFTQDERSFLILEYVFGRDLGNIMEKIDRFIPIDVVLTWAVEICDVLQYLHEHKPDPIIFRDIKPSNIMINRQNHVVLVDFGIAKNFSSEQKGTIVGTEGYSPPEQYRGNATPMADIYSLGATLHHILTRRDPQLEPPFSFSERPICKINKSVPQEFETIINRALQYDPEDRYQTIQEMQTDLKNIKKKIEDQKNGQYNLQQNGESSNRLLWKFEAGDELRGSPRFFRDMIFAGSYDKNLYAINSSDGKLLWNYSTEGGIVSQPLIFDNVVYFASEDHRLFAVSIRSGKLLWAYETGGPIRCSPRIAEGHVFIGSDDGNMHAVNMATTRSVWKTKVNGPVRSSPILSDGYVFFGSEGGELYALNYSGSIIWRFTTKKPITATPIIYEELVFFPSLDGQFYALNKRSGWEVWKFGIGKGSVSSPSLKGTQLVFGSVDGFIYSIDINSTSEIWKFDANSQVSGSPRIINNAVYCGTADGTFYCLDLESGSELWKYKTKGPITSRPDTDGKSVFITSADKNLYVFKI